MIKFLKSNKFITLLLLFICFVFILNPQEYTNSCLNAISVWAIKIVPVLFPFFVFTRIIISLDESKPNFMDKFFNKIYSTPSGSFKTFFLSILSGYPMGAKLICTQYDAGKINTVDAKKMLSFCSVSGPMFMIGTVGVGILCSYSAGIIIFISNILACLLNGLIYRNKKFNIVKPAYETLKIKTNLGEHVYDSLNSILMVGAYIILSFLVIDLLKNLNIIGLLSNTICWVFHNKVSHDVVSSMLCGLCEITRGIIELSNINLPIKIKIVLSSGLIGFGGLSVFFQTIHFVEKLGIKKGFVLLEKFTQGLLSLFISIILCNLFI